MKVQDWLAAAVAALVLAGCATANKEAVSNTANGVVAAGSPGALRQLPNGYRMVSPVDRSRADGKLFYLIRNGEQWRISFDAEEFNRSGGERLMYWPEGKRIAFAFDRSESGMALCEELDRDRKKRGYQVCNSAFSVKDNSVPMVGARVFVGVLTAGTSELLNARKQHERISNENALAVVERLDVDRQFWLKDYRARAAAGTVPGLNDFVRRYERDDPDNLVPIAKEKLGALARNAKVLAQAELTAPALGILRQRFLPANPQKYCSGLKSTPDDFKYCQSEAARIVGALADKRAAAERRLSVCQIVSSAVPQGQQPGLCQQYSTDSCRATSAPGQQVCDILNRKGQI